MQGNFVAFESRHTVQYFQRPLIMHLTFEPEKMVTWKNGREREKKVEKLFKCPLPK